MNGYEVALDSMGIYPQSITKNKKTKHRTDWQNGWNAAIMGLITKAGTLIDWFEKLTDGEQAIIDYFIDELDILMFRVEKDGKIKINMIVNDTFGYSCADAEPMSVYQLFKMHGVIKDNQELASEICIAYTAKMRGDMEVIKERQTDSYAVAQELVKDL